MRVLIKLRRRESKWYFKNTKMTPENANTKLVEIKVGGHLLLRLSTSRQIENIADLIDLLEDIKEFQYSPVVSDPELI